MRGGTARKQVIVSRTAARDNLRFATATRSLRVVTPAASRQPQLIAFALIGLVVAAYGGTLTCGFISMDDPTHVLNNPIVAQHDIVGAFTRTHAALWIPLTWLSFIAEHALAGFSAWVFHLTNVVLHATNAVLVWRWLEGATGRRWASVGVAACFAVHPLNVESVAWITERKNVLSTCFWLLSLLAWTRFSRSEKWRDYGLALAAGALAMLSKPMAVTLPGTLLLMDLWPLARWPRLGWQRLLAEKLPFALIAAFVSYMTLRAHADVGGLVSADSLTLVERALNAAASYGLYLRQLVWPFGLALLVRHPQQVPLLASIGGALAILALSVLAYISRKREPAVLWGWVWYLGTLFPVSGLMQAGSEASADRFTYIPQLGIFVAAVWALAPLMAARPRVMRCAGAALLMLWLALTVRQVAFWEDSLTLFDRTLAVNPRSFRGLVEAGAAHADRGDYRGSISRYRDALQIIPGHGETWTRLGFVFAKIGDKDRAKFAFRQALKFSPNLDVAQRSLKQLESEGSAATQSR